MKEYYTGIGKIPYEGPTSKNMLAFHYYNPEEIVFGKSMREHLKFAMSYWHTMNASGTDMFGPGTADKEYSGMDKVSIARAKAEAAFELMDKLNIDYYCFHDVDVIDEGETLEESNCLMDEAYQILAELQQKYNKKLLWGTTNCFSHPRFMSGAGTSPSADVFAYAAAKIKKTLELTVKLGGTGYVFWGGREGYETLLNTNTKLEQDNMAKLMHMVVDYGRKIGFKGDFFIEPKPKEPMKHQYDFDAATSLFFIHKYGLEKDFKLNIEANHATLAGHTFQHELRVARDNNALGSVDANQGDLLLGWDTDQFPTNVYDTTLAMYEILKNGGMENGGLNFDSKARRSSNRMDDTFYSYIAGMDAFALGLRKAVKMLEDGRIDDFVKQRYLSYEDGIGREIVDANIDLETLSDYALGNGEPSAESGRQEYLEMIMNDVLFG